MRSGSETLEDARLDRVEPAEPPGAGDHAVDEQGL